MCEETSKLPKFSSEPRDTAIMALCTYYSLIYTTETLRIVTQQLDTAALLSTLGADREGLFL
jgi:hypothetical protein